MRTLSRFAMLILVAAQTAPSNTSSITGIVSRAGTAEALDQAVVSLIPAANIAAPPNVETDAAGRFTFRSVPPGRYAIQVRREGYFGPLLHGASQPFASRLITLSEGQSIQDVHLDLIPGATVNGRVFDDRGVPVPGRFHVVEGSSPLPRRNTVESPLSPRIATCRIGTNSTPPPRFIAG